MPTMVLKTCRNCRDPMLVRAADVKRGWGKFCSKSCKAVYQENRTGQHRAYLDRAEVSIHEQAQADAEQGWDGHK